MSNQLGTARIDLDQFVDWAKNPQKLSWDPQARERSLHSHRLLMQFLQQGRKIYGVNTGFGEEGRLVVGPEGMARLQIELVSYHGCGTGPELSEIEGRAVLLARLCTLSRGYSGVRPELIEGLLRLYEAGIAPVIPEQGSVGASGDLTPLSYLAALVMGQRRAWYRGQIMPARDVLRELGIPPLELEGREALALMNGTAFMTALAILSSVQMRRWIDLAQTFTAWGALALDLEDEFFLDVPNRLKGHPGIRQSAQFLLGVAELEGTPVGTRTGPFNIQPRYSFRCAPQVYGMALESLEVAARWLENELAGVDDNPLIDPDSGRVYHNGNFSGFHVSLAGDLLRQVLASSMNLIDRQAQLLLDPAQNRGLGANLADWDPAQPRFGLKAVGIALSALAAEVQQLATSVVNLSRPTESGNQDVVSQGAVSARLFRRAMELARQGLGHFGWIAWQSLHRSGRRDRLHQIELYEQFGEICSQRGELEEVLCELLTFFRKL